MLFSIALILLLGLFSGWVFSRLRLPSLAGMILVGIAIGPYALNLLAPSLMDVSADLRQVALVVILTRAGLSLNLEDLKRVGRPAVLMCFVPACLEMLGTMLLAPLLFGISLLDAAIIGSVLSAVSPAVIVPRMIRLIDEGYGKDHSIPQLILAGASVDDIFVIVVFTALTSLASTGTVSALSFLQIPVSILTGILVGALAGKALVLFFKKWPVRPVVQVLIILSLSFVFLQLQTVLETVLPFSGLLAIMSLGILVRKDNPALAGSLSVSYNKLWIAAEVFLFVLVGATVNLRYVASAGFAAVLLVLGALVFRMAGVALSLVRTKLTRPERIFCMLAYTPKATVQAAIGAIPLSMGLPCGELVLTVAVLSILITAPFGAICIDKFYQKLLIQKS